MPIQFVTGDPFLTKADALAFGHNAKGRTEMDVLSNRLLQTYPAAVSSYTRAARRGRCNGGSIFHWAQTQPYLLFLTIRDSSVGATRLRHVQSALLELARDHLLYNFRSITFAPLGTVYERPEIHLLCEQWFSTSRLQVVVYTDYEEGKQAEERLKS